MVTVKISSGYSKIPKIIPGLMFAQHPFQVGLLLKTGLDIQHLIFGWKFAFKNSLVSYLDRILKLIRMFLVYA